MIEAENTHDVLSVIELKELIESMSDAEWMKLGKSADYLSWGLGIDGQDLLNIAFCKALEGKRKCRKGLPVLVFIYRAMESLVSAYLKKRKRDPLAQSVDLVIEDDLLDSLDLEPNIDTPEQILIAKETLEKIDDTLSGNETIEMVFMAQLDGYSPQEIQNLVGLTPVQYASTLTSIRRKLNKIENEESI
ncbi:sigma-70 family RNA polymerase sigma factor [Methylophilus sp. 13]|uniref:sigma-70 family RNA polymerase sigma factor n=1 Tax=Methylophilus sp. 13 TaxID=2781018 RepID=UPI00188F51B5|nr:sigma-70 family RNA polymerase sigma factor [Methylophilus sp. 13]MBF5039896.1 sigma-70 family RNA polymerase sigma factor [Methylophilus sp. 13]